MSELRNKIKLWFEGCKGRSSWKDSDEDRKVMEERHGCVLGNES
jgi:hypothetical protein